MSKSYDNKLTRLQFGIESVRHLIRQKLLFKPKDNIGIILKGSDNSESETDTPGIEVVRALNAPTIQLFSDLATIVPSDNEGDLFDSIEVAIQNFILTYAKRKWIKRIFIVTDGESEINHNSSQIQRISKALATHDIKVNIIAVDFFHEIEDIPEEENEIKNDNSSLPKETKNQKKTKEALQHLMENSDNVKVFTAKMADSIYKQFRKKKVNPVAKFRGPLVLTPEVHLEVAIFTKTAKLEVPSLKKQSLVTEANEDIKTGGIAQERVYFINDDPEQNPLEKDFITKAYNYGTSLVPISTTDERLFKNEEDKCLTAIGFTDAFRIPRHHFMSGVDLVTSCGNDLAAFQAIVENMIEMNKVMICRYVARQNADPKLVALSPHISKRGPVLYLNLLPTSEDMRDFQFDSMQECSKKQEEVVNGFVDSLDLENVGEDEAEVLKPNDTYNPILQYFYQCLEHKALGGHLNPNDNDENENVSNNNVNSANNINSGTSNNNLPSLDDTIADYLKPDKTLFENNKYVTFLPKMFDIKEVKKEDKKKRVFWKDMINNEMLENQEKRLEEKLEAHKEEAKKSVSTTRPIEDFKEMMNYKLSDLTYIAVDGMKAVIVKFINESFKGSYYIKALDCIKVLRDSCNDEDEVDLFNEFMDKLRHDFPKDKYVDFWRLLCDNRITLISREENVKSKITPEESKSWLEALNKRENIPSSLNDLDDLIADID